MVKPVPHGADSLLISRMAEFESQFWYVKTIAEQAQEESDAMTDEEFLLFVKRWLDRVEESPGQLWCGSQTIRWLHSIATEKVKPGNRSHPTSRMK